jgi:hypothetical protein
MTVPAGFLEARKRFHAALLEATLTIDAAGVPSNADKDSKASVAIAKGIAELLEAETIGERIAGQTSGSQFEEICSNFVRETFLELGTCGPAPGMFTKPAAATVWKSPGMSNMRTSSRLTGLRRLMLSWPQPWAATTPSPRISWWCVAQRTTALSMHPRTWSMTA